MSRMIRCIEGHVFDADSHAKCPECGWVPKKSARKPKQTAASEVSFGQQVAGAWDALIGGVEHGLGLVGLRDKPGLAAGIVYAGAILLLVSAASALPGTMLWPGNWGKGGGNPVALAPADTTVKPAPDKKEAEKPPESSTDKSAVIGPSDSPPPIPAPAPEEKKAPEKKTADTGDSDSAGNDAPAPAQTHRRRRQGVPQPQIHIPHDLRRVLRHF